MVKNAALFAGLVGLAAAAPAPSPALSGAAVPSFNPADGADLASGILDIVGNSIKAGAEVAGPIASQIAAQAGKGDSASASKVARDVSPADAADIAAGILNTIAEGLKAGGESAASVSARDVSASPGDGLDLASGILDTIADAIKSGGESAASVGARDVSPADGLGLASGILETIADGIKAGGEAAGPIASQIAAAIAAAETKA